MGNILSFILNSVLLGIGLAMDAFSVSLANGLNEPKMKKRKMTAIAGMFAFFQALMPMLGWLCIHTIVQCFASFEGFIPWIALLLLCYIGGKMIYDARRGEKETEQSGLGLAALVLQGVATSIDALSVGFTVAEYDLLSALICASIIATITFVICIGGLLIGKKVGTKLSGFAGIFGGSILIFIGLEIFITSFL